VRNALLLQWKQARSFQHAPSRAFAQLRSRVNATTKHAVGSVAKLACFQVDRGGRNIDLGKFEGAFQSDGGGGGAAGGGMADATPSRKRPRIRGV
jgi:hypothetical protein